METLEKLKRILAEWAEFTAPKFYPRTFDYSLLQGPEILSIIGARRAGKTYLCHQIIQNLKEKLPADNILYIDLEDERLAPFKGDELTLLWKAYLELFSPDLNKPIYFFIDEIQNAPNWSKWARRITEQNRNLKLIITGSSSKLLSQEIATELRGRTLSFAIYPLSFTEFLKARNISYEKGRLLYGQQGILIKKEFNLYFKWGGFPAVLETGQRKELLKECYRVMFYRDLIDRYKIKNTKLLEDYLNVVIDQVASHFSISSTASKLAQFGYSLSKNTLSNFSQYAQSIFLIFEIKKYSHKLKEQIRSTKKVYAIDHGLVQAIRFSFSEDYSRLLENIVFLALKRKGLGLYYHKEHKECDFLVVEEKRVKQAIQVAKSLGSPETKKREIEGLMESMERHQLKEGLIITEDEQSVIKTHGRIIRVWPAWRWLLE